MANLQNLLPELSEEGPPKSLSEFDLAFLRKLAKKLADKSPKQSDESLHLAVKIIAHINLAERNLLPGPFNKSERSTALFNYFRAAFFSEQSSDGGPAYTSRECDYGHVSSFDQEPESQIKGSRKDSSAFAETLTSPLAIDTLDWPGSPEELTNWVGQTLGERIKKKGSQEGSNRGTTKANPRLVEIRAIGQCTLSTGWAQELFGQSTQVFTPENIAQHLAAEVFESDNSAPARLLDPACGAGHLLIPSAQLWLSRSDSDPGSGTDTGENTGTGICIKQLETLFTEVITGLDVDHKLLKLCGFAFYLLARDHLAGQSRSANNTLGKSLDELTAKSQDQSKCELPLPRLFLSKSSAGSLNLGLHINSNEAKVKDTDEPKDTEDWFDLQGKASPKLSNTTYNKIVMNPPYLSTRIMGDTMATFLRCNYPDSAGDLYTAFIELAIRVLAPGGKLSMIVQQSFLSVQRYRAFRLKLLEECHIKSCLTLGLGSFSACPGEKVNSAVLTLERKVSEHDSPSRTIRVGRMENKSLSTSLIGEDTALATMAAISGNPFAFDCPAALANCFKELPALCDINGIAIVNGLFTCNNKKFVKLDSQLSESEKHLYVPYDKGGGQKWYHQTSHRLFWPDNGDSIRQYRKERGQSRALPGEEVYFKPGLTYSYIGTTGFKARLLSENSIFDIASSAIFSNNIDHHYLLGFLNSSLAIYLLGVLNPTINFQIGDLRRLPFNTPTAEVSNRVANLAKEAIAMMRRWQNNPRSIDSSEMVETERKIQQEIDTIIYQLYKIDKATAATIRDNEWVVGSRKKLIKLEASQIST